MARAVAAAAPPENSSGNPDVSSTDMLAKGCGS
jgi:hypothetical protein